jgi:hypothetical protein
VGAAFALLVCRAETNGEGGAPRRHASLASGLVRRPVAPQAGTFRHDR